MNPPFIFLQTAIPPFPGCIPKAALLGDSLTNIVRPIMILQTVNPPNSFLVHPVPLAERWAIPRLSSVLRARFR
jgi:hypothetical protein